MNDERNDLTPQERSEFSALPRARRPPPELENRVVRALASQALLRSRSRLRFAAAVSTLAAAAFLVGVWVGRGTGTAGPPEVAGERFVLLLFGGSPTTSAAEHAARAEEYGSWAWSLRRSGRFITGEALREGGRTLRAVATGIAVEDHLSGWEALNGYFIVEAEDYAEATRLAEGCPHLRYGGWIVIRAIRPT